MKRAGLLPAARHVARTPALRPPFRAQLGPAATHMSCLPWLGMGAYTLANISVSSAKQWSRDGRVSLVLSSVTAGLRPPAI